MINSPTAAARPGYQDGATIALLNRALATELVCMCRNRRYYSLSRDIYSDDSAERFIRQAGQESRHANRIARRIVELGGIPDLRPESVAEQSYVPYDACTGDPRDVFLPALLEDDLTAEAIATDAYREIRDAIGDRDPVTRDMLAEVIAAEEAHCVDCGGPHGFQGPVREA